ncbi:MAG: hypothetical protein BYD32DRAFT_203538 [Podila humilis]|nr:MAG: hypothetical protein BYD32DRAFT_203538 [Podila humilis]
MGPMGHDTMVHSEGHRNDSVSYPASPLSPGVMSKSKRRSEVFAAHESPYFFPATQHFNLFSLNQSMRYDLQVAAKIDRGFFLAANDWTCYRRNYFQISASFSIAGLDPSVQSEVPCLLERDDELLQVHRFMVCIGAHIQHGEKVIELVQHTPKRDKGPQITPRPTPIRAGGDVNSNASASNSNVITFERVQFKTATANNGKRRAAQQYYQVHVDLYAELDGGERVVVATAFSAPLVVRGRSPGHYADNEEAMSPQEYEGRNHPRNDSIASNGSVGSPPPSMYRYPNSYNSSYQYQSLGTASHMASQYHENGYYGHHDQEYPASPLSPIGPPHLGGMETPQSHYDSHYTPGSQGFSPESVSPDMYSPSGFPGSGPESPMSNLHQLAYMHDHNQTHPYDSYESHQDGYREHDQHHDEDDHETQMAGLRIHSPVSPVSSAAPTPRRQSFSSSLSKKGDRSSIGSMTRKTRSSSVSGISKRAPSKTRSTRNVSASSAKDFSKGLGISNDHIAESPMEELP